VNAALALTAVIEADEAAQPSTGGGPLIYILLGIAVVAMFVMSRRTKKKQAEAGAFRRELGPGQRVMTLSGMIGVVSQVEGDVITIMSASGDESAWLRKAIRSVVPDDEWEALTAEYPADPDEEYSEDADEDIDAAEDGEPGETDSSESDTK